MLLRIGEWRERGALESVKGYVDQALVKFHVNMKISNASSAVISVLLSSIKPR
jgi:hypothetical protein